MEGVNFFFIMYVYMRNIYIKVISICGFGGVND